MYTATASNSTISFTRQRRSLAETIAFDHVTGRATAAKSSVPGAGYDEVLLVAALEEIDSQRVAIEWLLDVDLLRTCMA